MTIRHWCDQDTKYEPGSIEFNLCNTVAARIVCSRVSISVADVMADLL
jgi:hypothetical protein